MVSAVRILSGAIVVATGCRGTDSKPTQPAASATVQAAPEGLTCWEIIQCYTPCGTDAPCLDACLARGAQVARAQVNAVIECSTRCNNEAQCVSDSCHEPIATCRAVRPPHAIENILPWLTGVWISADHHFVFHAVGTVERSLSVAIRGGCASSIIASGPVAQDGDVLIMDLGPEAARSCNTPVEGAGPKQVRYRVDWLEVPNYSGASQDGTKLQLRLRDLDCAECSELLTRG